MVVLSLDSESGWGFGFFWIMVGLDTGSVLWIGSVLEIGSVLWIGSVLEIGSVL
jgi:hypothetical protein